MVCNTHIYIVHVMTMTNNIMTLEGQVLMIYYLFTKLSINKQLRVTSMVKETEIFNEVV